MKTYEFYEKDKYIGVFELKNDNEANDKAIELASVLSMTIRQPIVTFKEVDYGKKII